MITSRHGYAGLPSALIYTSEPIKSLKNNHGHNVPIPYQFHMSIKRNPQFKNIPYSVKSNY